MAAASVSIYANGIEVRTYGGNRSDVRRMTHCYQSMTVEEFNQKHPFCSVNRIEDISVYPKYNKQ